MNNKKENKDIVEGFDKISLGLDNIGSKSNSKIIIKSKYIDIADNKVKGNKLSKTNKGARDEARFRNTRLGMSFDESGTPPEEIKESVKSLANKYMKEILDQAFGV